MRNAIFVFLVCAASAACRIDAPHYTADDDGTGDGGGVDAARDSAMSDAAIDANAIDAMPVTLTVNRSGGGQGTISWSGHMCGAGCSSLTTPQELGSTVTLTALPTNGTGSYFAGFTGACSGIERVCTVTMTQALSVTATFDPQPGNLVFVTSVSFAANLGGATAYDAACNTMATAAGINNPTNTAFVSFMSDANSLATNRIGSARGFYRMDGLPFADDLATLMVVNAKIFYPLIHDENGVDLGDVAVFSGTDRDGDAHPRNCQNWTTISDDPTPPYGGFGGQTDTGPGGMWVGGSLMPCETPEHLLCFEKTSATVVTPVPVIGKKIFLTPPIAIGSNTPDGACDAAKPGGVVATHAVVATTSVSAASLLVPGTTYVRPDGVRIGTGVDLVSGSLFSGPWQQGGGAYAADPFWTGSDTIGNVGVDTCANWTDPSSALTTTTGWPANLPFWWHFSGYDCSTPHAFLCVEE